MVKHQRYEREDDNVKPIFLYEMDLAIIDLSSIHIHLTASTSHLPGYSPLAAHHRG